MSSSESEFVDSDEDLGLKLALFLSENQLKKEIACALSQESSKQNFDSNENGNSINSSIKQDKGYHYINDKTENPYSHARNEAESEDELNLAIAMSLAEDGNENMLENNHPQEAKKSPIKSFPFNQKRILRNDKNNNQKVEKVTERQNESLLHQRLVDSAKEETIKPTNRNKKDDVDFSDKKFFEEHLSSILDQELNSMLKVRGKNSQKFSNPKSSNGIQNASSPEKKRGVSSDQNLFESISHFPNEILNEVINSDENSSTESESESDGNEGQNFFDKIQELNKFAVKKNETDRSINTGTIPKLFARKRDETHQNKVKENRDLRFIMREQEKVQRNADNRDEFECVICFETYSLLNSESFGCTHLFCKNCLVEHLSGLIKEGRLDSLKCPQPKCDTIASEQMMKQILPQHIVFRYNNLQLKRAVEEMDDIFYCPECNDPVECDISVGFGECFGCNFNFCTSCLKPFHGTSDCDLDDEERKHLLKEYIAKQNAEQVLKAREKEIAEQKRKDLELKRQMKLKQESLSNSFINSSFKKCPGCKANIEKDGYGCNHMKCSKCNTDFCWLCLMKLIGGDDKSLELHYTKCTLFSHDFITD